ncbi:MAG: hypothetical protein IJV05_10690 [Muribaculaceae bacterium]|nr:hypothetical protein [Muribaculaceae bacterium]
MKKFLSLLFVALLAMSAWADVTVTFDPNVTKGKNAAANALDEMTLDGVTISGTKAAFNATSPAYRFAGGSKATVSSAVGNIKKVEFTCEGSYSQSYGPDQFYGDGYTCQSGSRVGIWQGDAESFTLSTASQVRCTLIVVTIAEDEVEDLVPPVFNPNGGEFSGSLAVTVSCPTKNASIFVYKVIDGEIDYTTGDYYFQSGEFYVTETMTYAAYAEKGNESTDFVYVTFTKVEQTVEVPVFTPASCSFLDRVDVTLSCATPNAKIFYSLDNEQWSEYVDAIPVTTDLTIWAKAAVGDVESEIVSATYTKLPETTVDVTFDAAVDKGNGEQSNRHSYTIVKDQVTMYVGDGTVYGDHYRIYGPNDSSAFVFTSAGAPIVKIELSSGTASQTPSNLSLVDKDNGRYTTSGNKGTWEGYAQEVAFKVNSQVRCYTVIVTLASSEVPEFELGDVNHDGKVNIDDVTAMIDYLLADPATMPIEGDVDQDGKKNIDDVTALIDILLGK